jgi:aminoglycoside 3-N-acetyltransferase
VLPTFTYSFCRHEPFDIRRSPSTVGVLSEYFRQRPGVRRTAEPIFSTAILGDLPDLWEQELFSVGDTDCFGERSIFALLMAVDAKIAFLGVDPSVCTFVYHVEQQEQDFRGIIAEEQRMAVATARYYVRDLAAGVENDFTTLTEALREQGELAEMRFDRGAELLVASANGIAGAARDGLRSDPSFLLKPRSAQHARASRR